MKTRKMKMSITLLWAAMISAATLAMAAGTAGAQENGILYSR